MRQGLGAVALVAALVAIVSFAVAASPLMKSRSPAEPFSSRLSLLHRAVIYAKEGRSRLSDGRWNLSQSEAKLGIELSAEETKQLIACTGQIVCQAPGIHDEEKDTIGAKVTASAVSVLRPDLLVTAKHVFFEGKKAMMPFGSCSFRSYSRRKVVIPVMVDTDQRAGYIFHNEDFIVLRLKRALEDCGAFGINASDSSLQEGEEIFSVTGAQVHTLNKISDREPVVAKGVIKEAFSGRVLGGPPFYYADLDFDLGGSGGAIFALRDGHPVSDDKGRPILRGLSVAYGLHAKNGAPYSEERNYTVIVGLEGDFRDVVKGKAEKPATVEPQSCPGGGAARIDVVSASVASVEPETPAPSLGQFACGRQVPDHKAQKNASSDCAELSRGVKLAASRRPAEKHEFRLKNDTSCTICFTYDRCNDYGCWDEAAKANGKSILFAGVRQRAPAIKNPQFCK